LVWTGPHPRSYPRKGHFAYAPELLYIPLNICILDSYFYKIEY
jgi:hypothetical protein